MARFMSKVRDTDGTVYFRLSEAASVGLAAAGELRVLSGRAWVTINGQPRDWFLVPGKALELAFGQKLLAQADPDCVLGWREQRRPASSRPTRLRMRWATSMARSIGISRLAK